jgi:hypothetical protein
VHVFRKAANRVRCLVSDAFKAARMASAARMLSLAGDHGLSPQPCYLSRHFPGPPAGVDQLAT